MSFDLNSTYAYKQKPLPFREAKIARLLFEDRHIFVIDKQAGVLSVPTEDDETRTVLGALERYLRAKRDYRTQIVAVHRLDRDTSGVLVFAKNQAMADQLIGQFREHKPQREYLAIVAGLLGKESGTIEARMFVDQFHNQRVTRRPDAGVNAITHYETLARLDDSTLVRVQLETGRKNQIRAHFAEKNHPVLGDTRYKRERAKHRLWPHKRLALHAASLTFAHPATGQTLAFCSPVPEEFGEFLRRARLQDVWQAPVRA